MAIAEIYRIRIMGHQAIKEEVLQDLQRWGKVEITSVKERLGEEAAAYPFAEVGHQDTATLEKDLSQIERSIAFLENLSEEKSLLPTKTRISLTKEEFVTISRDFKYHKVCAELLNIEAQLKDMETEMSRLLRDEQELLPWHGLDLPIKDIISTKTTRPLLVTINVKDLIPLYKRLDELKLKVFIEELVRTPQAANLLFISHLQDIDGLEQALKEFNAREVRLPEYMNKPQEATREIEGKVAEIDRQTDTLRLKVASLSSVRSRLMAAYDWLFLKLSRIRTGENLAATKSAFVIEGWMERGKFKGLEDRLSGYSELIVEYDIPGPEENPPVVLKNPSPVEPFELVTTLYGLPKKRMLDPTPLLAPFFFLFFGICLTDAGYGLALAALSLLALRKMRLGGQGNRLVRLLTFCGFASVICGIALGGFFGNLFNLLPPQFALLRTIQQRLTLFDPMKKPMLFLGICLALGYIQVLFGIGVRIYSSLKEGDFLDALLVRLMWMLLLIGALVYGLFIFEVLGAGWAVAAKWTMVISSLSIVSFASRGSKNILARVGGGLFNLYGAIGYLSDVLSYSRLLALGLATSVIAMVVNTLINEIVLPIPFVGVLLAVVVFVGGHTFNMAINTLNSFLHTSRLQFVEFFMKFYESGGRVFKPFSQQTKYVMLEEV